MGNTNNRQTPWESSSLIGDFYFSGEGVVSAKNQTPQVTEPTGNSKVDEAEQQLSSERQRVQEEKNQLDEERRKLEQEKKRKEAEEQSQALEQEKNWLKAEREKLEEERLAMANRPKQESGTTGGASYTDTVTGMEFVKLPNGIYMGKYAVTNAQFRKFKPSHDSKDYKGNSLNGDNQPVVNVSANDADDFVRWLSGKTGKKYSLPTEEEFESACKAGTGKDTYWDKEEDACRYANVHDKTAKRAFNFDWSSFNCDDGYAVTSPVGSFKANNYGLYDMLGNVWQWTSSVSDENRVFRGGSCQVIPQNLRCSNRNYSTPGSKGNVVGFRLKYVK
ncbi:MAG: SUMF1/EgtB/PvdO family nonheme iron enzyme [Nitrospirae bacterium]|nr:SUMF1/EgtB/PvdO family nonheme iron enzyme [Nitrospirota bacterium]MBF0533699.1 SUMF1/EgtB/PvdO family nonheme iron enzyme [Nitrospirota bacterium]MBF0615592.1 SUMF1/EgtB/PvdO family nonheme iron enzyme [Nitrospirota bacterium]